MFTNDDPITYCPKYDLLRVKGVDINNYTRTTGTYNHSHYIPVYLYDSQTSVFTPRRLTHASITINFLHIYLTLTIYEKIKRGQALETMLKEHV